MNSLSLFIYFFFFLDNLSSLEDGLIGYEVISNKFDSKRKHSGKQYIQFSQFIKVLLYLELVLFFGWIACIFVTNFYEIYEHKGLGKYDSGDSVKTSGSVSSTTIWSTTEQDVTKRTIVMSEPEPVNEGPNILGETATTMTDNPIDPDNLDTDALMSNPHESDTFTKKKSTWEEDANNDANNDDYLDDSAIWQDPEYMDILSDLHRDLLLSVNRDKSNFDSEFLDSGEFRPSNQGSMNVDHKDNWFPKSREETHNVEWNKRRSAESSSSEETKTLAPSSANEEITEKKVQEENDNCWAILDENGPPGQDVWKRYWFDCVFKDFPPRCGPKFKTTMDVTRGGEFLMTCELEESSEITNTSNESVTNVRSVRSVGEDRQQDDCAKLVEASRVLETWGDRMMLDNNDLVVRDFYRDFANAILPLAVQKVVELPTGERNNSNEHWRKSIMEIKQNLSTTMKYRRILEENTATIDAMANELRNTVEAVADTYKKCNLVETSSEEAKRAMRAITMLIERERCTKNFESMETKFNSLAAEIVKGDTLDKTVMELRERFKYIVLSLSKVIDSKNKRTPQSEFPTGPVNVTVEQWQSYMLGLKQDIARSSEDPVIRQRLEAGGPPSQEQAEQLREIIEYILRGWRYCYRDSFFGLRGTAKHAASN